MQDLQHAFPAQDPGEAVFVFARPYWFTFLGTILIFVAIFIFSLVIQYIAATHVLISIAVSNDIILAIGIFQLFALTVFLVAVLDFYYDLLVVTDQRLVTIDQEQLFYRKFSQLNLEEVEDATTTNRGFFQTFLDYGTLQVQTAGEQEEFIIPNLRHPTAIAGIISSLARQAKEGVKDEQRIPSTQAVGVIDGRIITEPAALVPLGAMLSDDSRLATQIKSNAA